MDLSAFYFVALLFVQTLLTVHGTATVAAWYDETIVVPCNNGVQPSKERDLMFIKWTYKKDDGTEGDLLIKQYVNKRVTVQATDDYAKRIAISEDSSLLISRASLRDQKTFICRVASDTGLTPYSISVFVKKKPSSVQIINKSEVLQTTKLTTVGTCIADSSNPAADIKWKRRGELLVADGKGVVISHSLNVDPATGLSTTSSTLQYTAAKEDIGAVFACVSTYEQSNQEIDMEPFPVHYPSEKVNLQIVSQGPVVEGDNVTLKCHADGNPPPSSFFFFIKDEKILVENSDNYTLTFISREGSGEYTCSLVDNEEIKASEDIAVMYIDLTLSPTGRIVKKKGESLSVNMEKSTSGPATVSWKKNRMPVKEPQFSNLTYADAGVYVCDVSMTGLSRQQSFELVVEGEPSITNLSKQSVGNHQVLTCEAEGFPEPTILWSINGTNEVRSYINGKAIHKITISPETDLTVTCSVSNTNGRDSRSFTVFSESSMAHSNITVVVVLVAAAAAAVGVIFLLFRRKKKGNKGKKEKGTREEREELEIP